jgi:hypothetical protein
MTFNSFRRADLLHHEMIDAGRGSHCWRAKNHAPELRLPQWSTAICLGVALPNPSPSHGRGLAYLHLTEAELTERSNRAIAKLDDLAPTTNDDPSAHHMRMSPPAFRHPPHHSRLRPLTYEAQEGGSIGRLGRTNRSTSRGLTRC